MGGSTVFVIRVVILQLESERHQCLTERQSIGIHNVHLFNLNNKGDFQICLFRLFC